VRTRAKKKILQGKVKDIVVSDLFSQMIKAQELTLRVFLPAMAMSSNPSVTKIRPSLRENSADKTYPRPKTSYSLQDKPDSLSALDSSRTLPKDNRPMFSTSFFSQNRRHFALQGP
jgi:hypothetical protein